MRKYCRAYHLRDLRQFGGWTEKSEANESELTDDDVVYLWDDFSVVRSPVIPDRGLVFDTISTEWKNFCMTTLHFAIPEDLQYAYEQSDVSETSGEEQSATSV